MVGALRVGFVLLVAAGVSASDRPAFRPPAVVEEPLTCTIRGPATCELGTGPDISVEIANRGGRAILLVGSLDASDCKWRYPHCYFEVIGPNGGSAVRGYGRCGLMSPLREKDFVEVPAGGRFNPYRRVDDFGFFTAHQISAGTFQEVGEYRVRFVYSTAEPDIKKWQGDGALQFLLDRVPKTTLRSNEITVKVVAPAKK